MKRWLFVPALTALILIFVGLAELDSPEIKTVNTTQKAKLRPIKISALAASTVPKPKILADFIPYPAQRKTQMATYSKRHYGVRKWQLVAPKLVLLHFTETDTWRPVWNLFAANTPARGELPGTCTHFVIDKAGGVHQLVPLGVRCRHAVGLNHRAIGIEFVQATHGNSASWADQQILNRRKQIRAGLALVRWLTAKYDLPKKAVIGHSMVNQSPYFKDLQGWKNDHTDWQLASIKKFRGRL